MCGIVYSKSFVGSSVNKTIVKRYKNQRNRGTDGFGFYIPKNDKLVHNVKESRILRQIKKGKDTEILFHHRLPTSTTNVRNACHPFSTKQPIGKKKFFKHNYIVVHNGVLRNEHALKTEHEKLGIRYVSEQKDGRFNDSEALAYDLALYLEGKQTEMKASGSIAFVVIQRSLKGSPQKLFFGRNYGNPLKVKFTTNSLTISSQGSGEDVEAHKLYEYDYKTNKIVKKPLTINGYLQETYTNRYYSYGYYDVNNKWQTYETPHTSSAGWGDKDRYSRTPVKSDPKPFWEDDEFDELIGLSLEDVEFQEAEKSEIKHVRERLMNDCNFDKPEAIKQGKEELDVLKKRQVLLYTKIEISRDATKKETQEFADTANELIYLRAAIAEMEKEVRDRQVPMGFQYRHGHHLPAQTYPRPYEH